MNKREAVAEGLRFAGIYNSSKEKTKAEIAEAKKTHPKARILLVCEPHDKLSRGYSVRCGWSAYADDVYSAYEVIKECGKIEDRYESEWKYYKDEFDKKIAELDRRRGEAGVRRRAAQDILRGAGVEI